MSTPQTSSRIPPSLESVGHPAQRAAASDRFPAPSLCSFLPPPHTHTLLPPPPPRYLWMSLLCTSYVLTVPSTLTPWLEPRLVRAAVLPFVHPLRIGTTLYRPPQHSTQTRRTLICLKPHYQDNSSRSGCWCLLAAGTQHSTAQAYLQVPFGVDMLL